MGTLPKKQEIIDRLCTLEELVGVPEEEQSHQDLFAQIHDVLEEMAKIHGHLTPLAAMKQETECIAVELLAKQKQIDDLRAQYAKMAEEMMLLRKAVLISGGSEISHSKIKVPEPKPFGGARNAKDLENFLWDMEQYFIVAHIPENEKVTMTSMYLANDAKLWWRTRDDVSAGRPKVETWEALKEELKEQFLPQNTSWIARDNLKKLKQTGSVRDYVKEFSSLMLDIKNMSEDDKLFNFMSGLQSWAQTELRRQGVRDLSKAITAADGLIDYKLGDPDVRFSEKRKEKGKVTDNQDGSDSGAAAAEKGGATTKGPKNGGCFVCGGPHRMRDCPKKAALNAIIADEEASSSGKTSSVEVKLNSMQVADR